MLLDEVVTVPVRAHEQGASWGQALRANWWLLLLALILFTVAAFLTFSPPF
jgi:hypothetical protein